jgi:hypothetical protein
MTENVVSINRAPVLTLWGAVVAEVLGYEQATALTLGKALAGLNAQSKGRTLGIYRQPESSEDGLPAKKTGLGEEFWVEICERAIPAKNTEEGVRAVVKDQPIDPASVEKYLRAKFGESYETVRTAMEEVARSFPRQELARKAYMLYERFRPAIPSGQQGWGAKGELRLDIMRSLARESRGM